MVGTKSHSSNPTTQIHRIQLLRSPCVSHSAPPGRTHPLTETPPPLPSSLSHSSDAADATPSAVRRRAPSIPRPPLLDFSPLPRRPSAVVASLLRRPSVVVVSRRVAPPLLDSSPPLGPLPLSAPPLPARVHPAASLPSTKIATIAADRHRPPPPNADLAAQRRASIPLAVLTLRPPRRSPAAADPTLALAQISDTNDPLPSGTSLKVSTSTLRT